MKEAKPLPTCICVAVCICLCVCFYVCLCADGIAAVERGDTRAHLLQERSIGGHLLLRRVGKIGYQAKKEIVFGVAQEVLLQLAQQRIDLGWAGEHGGHYN